jgi:hypothetical protein
MFGTAELQPFLRIVLWRYGTFVLFHQVSKHAMGAVFGTENGFPQDNLTFGILAAVY